MHVICTAVVENPLQRENLCQCINIVGGVPAISRETVCVDYTGNDQEAEKFVEIFEQYCRHEIKILKDG